MDFSLGRELEMLRSMVQEFAERKVGPQALALDERAEFPFALAKEMGQLGLMGLTVSREYGGTALGHVARAVAIEEVSKVYASLGFFLQTGGILPYALEAFGTEEQKRKYLPALARAEKIGAFALTEAGGGSDPGSMQSTARPADDGYILNGRKVFITLPEVADIIGVVARTGEGFSAFLIEKGTPGFEITRRETHFGLRAAPVNEFVLSDCKVPRANLLGPEGRGLVVGITGISVMGRLGAAAVALGTARGCYEAALKFAKERKLYGKPIAELQALQFMLVDISTEIEAAKWLVYRPAQLLDEGKSARELGTDIARAKLYACEVAARAAASAVRIMGGYGTTPEYQVVRRLRDAIELWAGAGTQEIMKVTIGRAITS
ncbi:MAG: acyl-CoA dehydrogenase family protein [Chloroflexi bacterium]|nr:acyl-CoA dehydrogenase family protein [Chloroflexota bacterium]